MNYSLIVAMDNNRLIGSNNALPWYLPADLKHVKELTEGKTIIMGRKNYESIGRPLPNRLNVILTRNENFRAQGCEIYHTVDDILDKFKGEDVFIFGGEEVYKLFLPYVTTLYITVVDGEFEGDTYFPEIDMSEWYESVVIRKEVDERNEYRHSFLVYRKISAENDMD